MTRNGTKDELADAYSCIAQSRDAVELMAEARKASARILV